ncbi:hypothetical protein D210916BOD24_23370 [Alteromonas sp. D210916BOD_24]|uniref:serine/threonine-protein kinase n=1 Tax=Alteromonas sp. D210916BOD_24 TaxID=3157618 RepID=UPI00399D5694
MDTKNQERDSIRELAKKVLSFIESSVVEKNAKTKNNYSSVQTSFFEFVFEGETESKNHPEIYQNCRDVVAYCANEEEVSIEEYLNNIKLEQRLIYSDYIDEKFLDDEERNLKSAAIKSILISVISEGEQLPHNTPLLWGELKKFHSIYNSTSSHLNMELFTCCRKSLIHGWIENQDVSCMPSLSKGFIRAFTQTKKLNKETLNVLEQLSDSIYTQKSPHNLSAQLWNTKGFSTSEGNGFKPVELLNANLNHLFNDIPSLLIKLSQHIKPLSDENLFKENISDVFLHLIFLGIDHKLVKESDDLLIALAIKRISSISALKKILSVWSISSEENSLINMVNAKFDYHKTCCIAISKLWLCYLYQRGEHNVDGAFESLEEFVQYHAKAFYGKPTRIIRVKELSASKTAGNLKDYILDKHIGENYLADNKLSFQNWYTDFINTFSLDILSNQSVPTALAPLYNEKEISEKVEADVLGQAFDIYMERLACFHANKIEESELIQSLAKVKIDKSSIEELSKLLSTSHLTHIWENMFFSLDKALFTTHVFESFLLDRSEKWVTNEVKPDQIDENYENASKSKIIEAVAKSQTEGKFKSLINKSKTLPHKAILINRFHSNRMTISKLSSLGSSSKYEIINQLGAGSSGSVFLCRDNVLQRDVAVKVIVPISPNGEASFMLHEAQKLAKLRQSNIVEVYDFLKIPTSELMFDKAHPESEIQSLKAVEYVYGIVMEYHPKSRTLNDYLACELPQLAFNQRIIFFRKIIDAVSAVHSAGLVHGDINPSNIIVDSNGEPTLIDFSAAVSSEDISITAGSTIYTSDRYLELADSNKVLRKSDDVFSLAVVFLELLECDIKEYFSSLTRKCTPVKVKEEIYEALLKLKLLQQEWTNHLGLGWLPFVRDNQRSTEINLGGETITIDSPAKEFGKYWKLVCHLFSVLAYDETRLGVLLDILLSTLAPVKEKQNQLMAKLDEDLRATIWNREYKPITAQKLKNLTYQILETSNNKSRTYIDEVEVVTVFGRPLTINLLDEIRSEETLFVEYEKAFNSEPRWLPKLRYGVIEKPIYLEGKLFNEYNYGVIWEGFGVEINYQVPFSPSSSFTLDTTLLWKGVQTFNQLFLDTIDWLNKLKNTPNISLPISMLERLTNSPIVDTKYMSFNQECLSQYLTYLKNADDKFAKPPVLQKIEDFIRGILDSIFESIEASPFSRLAQKEQQQVLTSFMQDIEFDLVSDEELNQKSAEWLDEKSTEILVATNNRTTKELELFWEFLGSENGSQQLSNIYNSLSEMVNSADFEQLNNDINSLNAHLESSWEYQLYNEYKNIKIVSVLEEGLL